MRGRSVPNRGSQALRISGEMRWRGAHTKFPRFGMSTPPNALSTSSSTTNTRMVSVFYSNVTSWGTLSESKENRCEKFLSTENSDIVIFVEHHLDKDQFSRIRPKLKSLRRAAYVSHAKRIGLHQASTSGGQLILPRDSWDTLEPDPALIKHCLPREHAQAPRWTAMVLRTRGVSILFIAVYLRTSEGLSEQNLSIMNQIFLLVAFFHGIVLMVGDFQMTPSQMSSIPAISKLGLQVVAPDVDATCTAGLGRVIDFSIVSVKLAPFLQIEPELKVPWKSHIGLRLSFPARLRSLSAPVLQTPRPLPQLPLVDGQHELQEHHWHHAGRLAREFVHKRSFGTGILGCDLNLISYIKEPQKQLSIDHCFSSTQLEFYRLLVAGVPPKERSRYLGRGALPHVAIRPVIGRSFMQSRYVCSICDLWDMLGTLLDWMSKFVNTGAAAKNAQRAIVDAKTLQPRIRDSWSRGAAPNAPVKAWEVFLENLTVLALSNKQPGFTADRLLVWQARALAQKKVAMHNHKVKVRHQFRRWLKQDLDTGGSGAHKLIADKPPVDHAPRQKLQSSFDFWADMWRDRGQSAAYVSFPGLFTKWIPWKKQLQNFVQSASPTDEQQAMLAELREAVIASEPQQPQAKFDAKMLKSASASYPNKKGKGIDAWSSGDFRLLPETCLQPMADTVASAYTLLLWPVQIMLNVMALIPKNGGGERSIAKTPLLYRLFNVWRTPALREWGNDTVKSWDFASKGNSALISGALRAWANEVAAITGQSVATILWDIEKFFDSLSARDVYAAALRMGYPPSELILALSMHLAPRCLLLNGVASCIILPSRSIIAGCSHSNYFARMPMEVPIERMLAEAPGPRPSPALRVSTFVDDVAQSSRGSIARVADVSIRAAIAFCSSVKTLGLKVSAKSVVVASDPKLAKAIAGQILKFQGVRVIAASSGRDLGVVNNPTNTRRVALHKQRLDKATKKLKRISSLAKGVRAARRLTTTGALPQALWGAGVVGLPPTVVKALRTSTAASSGITAAGRCPITAIAVAFGETFDPEVLAVTRQVSLWLEIWRSDASLRASSIRYWKSMCNNVLRAVSEVPGVYESSWNSVTGPMGATICAMNDQGWNVLNPASWVDPAGNAWIPDVVMARQPFVDLVQSFAVRRIWVTAALHWAGLGMQSGIDWKPTLALYKHIAKLSLGEGDGEVSAQVFQEMNQAEIWPSHALSWLELLLTGGYWPAQRAASVHPISDRCTRCGRHPESALHLLWTCACNAQIRDVRVRSTQHLIGQAQDGVKNHPCLWLRGLLPKALVVVNTPHVHEAIVEYVGTHPTDGCWPAGTYYTDCSGGTHGEFTELRRCGVGVVMLRSGESYDFSSLSLSLLFFSFIMGRFQPAARATANSS